MTAKGTTVTSRATNRAAATQLTSKSRKKGAELQRPVKESMKIGKEFSLS